MKMLPVKGSARLSLPSKVSFRWQPCHAARLCCSRPEECLMEPLAVSSRATYDMGLPGAPAQHIVSDQLLGSQAFLETVASCHCSDFCAQCFHNNIVSQPHMIYSQV